MSFYPVRDFSSREALFFYQRRTFLSAKLSETQKTWSEHISCYVLGFWVEKQAGDHRRNDCNAGSQKENVLSKLSTYLLGISLL